MADNQRRAAGPLVVAEANPRYFTVASGDAAGRRAVYLTGSHIWNNLHDGLGPGASCAEVPERNDYDAYLDFLVDQGHNFIRLWRWEHFKSQAAGGAFHLCMTPQPWPRTGPGAATDGKPRFDLSRFDAAYFGRLRDRVAAAGEKGIYVAVMLFDGFCLHLSPRPTTSRATRSRPPTTSTGSGSPRSSTTRASRSTRGSRGSRRRTSGRSSTPSTTCQESSARSPTNRRAIRPTPRWATRPGGSTG
jgi:hypothetical protein